MSEVDHFKVFVVCNNDVDHLHVKNSLSGLLLYSYRGKLVHPSLRG
jgi:hypothetical protein